MKRIISILVVVFAGSIIIASSAVAGPATESLIACMSDNTTGKDRKDLARWIFVGMSIHPELQSLSNVTEADRDQLDRRMAAIVTRLLIESCQAQVKLAVEKERGEDPLKTAFTVMGQLAMQELMANAEVDSAFKKFVRYVDAEKLRSVFSGN